MERPIRHIVLALTVLSAACGEEVTGLCPGVLLPAVIVEVADARTRRWLAASASGHIDDGTTSTPLKPYETDRSLAGGHTLGVYDVTVHHAGYLTWRMDDVRVTEAACHLIPSPVRIRADLIPAMAG